MLSESDVRFSKNNSVKIKLLKLKKPEHVGFRQGAIPPMRRINNLGMQVNKIIFRVKI